MSLSCPILLSSFLLLPSAAPYVPFLSNPPVFFPSSTFCCPLCPFPVQSSCLLSLFYLLLPFMSLSCPILLSSFPLLPSAAPYVPFLSNPPVFFLSSTFCCPLCPFPVQSSCLLSLFYLLLPFMSLSCPILLSSFPLLPSAALYVPFLSNPPVFFPSSTFCCPLCPFPVQSSCLLSLFYLLLPFMSLSCPI